MEPYTLRQLIFYYFARLRKDLRLVITNHNLVPANRNDLANLATKLEKNLKEEKRSTVKTVTHNTTANKLPAGGAKKKEREQSKGREHKPREPRENPRGGGQPATKGKPLSEVECFNCHEFGHYANECRSEKRDDPKGNPNKLPLRPGKA